MKFVKEVLKNFVPERKHFGHLVFIDVKLQVFAGRKLQKLFRSNRKGFLIQIDKKGGCEILNPYRFPQTKNPPLTLNKLLKDNYEIERDIKKCKRDKKNIRAIKPTELVPTVLTNLPKRVLVLDIETTGELNEKPNPKRILVVGIKEFNLVKGGFLPSKFEHFDGSDNWAALKSRLEQPFDIILGHNLFGFDYYFLEDILNLQSLIPKTVDLFLWLYTCAGSHKWLGLDNLSRMNLGAWKLCFGKSVKGLSVFTDKSLFFRYNERDLDLTFRLWLRAVEQKHIKTLRSFFLKANVSDLDYLLGRKNLVDFQLWSEKKRDWTWKQLSPLNSFVIAKKLGNHDVHKICWQTYNVVVCGRCKVASVYLISEPYERVLIKNTEDASPHRLVKGELTKYKLRCEKCNHSINSRSLALPIQIGNFEIKKQKSHKTDFYARDEEDIFSLISNNQRLQLLPVGCYDDEYFPMWAGLDIFLEDYWKLKNSWMNSVGFGRDFCCQTCGHALTIHDLPFVHPFFKTPLCQACIRLGRHRYFHKGQWLPRLKYRQFNFSGYLIPTNYAWNLSAYQNNS